VATANAPQVEVLAVGAVVFDREGRVLLVQRGTPPGASSWTLPGGRVEPGEHLADAVVREVREETSIECRVVCGLGVVSVVREGYAYAIHEHLAEPVGELALRHGDDAADARWSGLDELASLGVRPDAVAVIQHGLAEAIARGNVTQC
jgi:ADP-ribose pyrophosphatase YjhB (NUDIX family)